MASRTAQQSNPLTLNRWRLNVVLLVAMLLLVRVILHLAYLQVGDARVGDTSLRDRVRAELNQEKSLPPRRGVIRDRAGDILALTVDRRSLFVNPEQVRQADAPRLAIVLSSLLGMPSGEVLDALMKPDRVWVPIKRRLEPVVSDRIIELMEQDPAQWSGLMFEYEQQRVYPRGEFAAHIIGAANLEGMGISGVEGYYNEMLSGSTGTITGEVDAQQNPIWISPQEVTPPTNGVDLELTIDPFIQQVAEREIKRAVDDHNADGGVAIVMDVKTGALRAVASYPTYNPNTYYEYPEERYNINPAVSALYEPGSTFKIATVAIGMQSRAFTADTEVYDSGTIDRYGYNLGNWNRAPNGPLTPEGVLYYSSNVGALLLNEKTGTEAFYQAVDAFGYGKTTGVDVAGEGEGIVPDPNAPGWSPLVRDTNAFGQGIAVTPLQQVRMVAALGNDGTLMRPYVVQRRCRGDDCVVTEPKPMGQPIEPGVAWTVRRMLVHSANHYAPVVWAPVTGSYDDTFLVPGYEVCAKTGTSSIPDGRGGYETDGTIGSVVGLMPAERPRYAVLVKIDRPRDDIWGVSTAIPVYQAIAEQVLRYERIAPDPSLVGQGQRAGVSAEEAP